MFGLGVPEILVIGGILVLLFGAKKIPELAKGLGQGLKVFKKELSSESEKKESDEEKSIKDQTEEKEKTG